ncbi:MAG: YihY/virulence factor BrkB family protein [Caldilineaceae bacterium]|nr:YihY/virulence factor BrkB family protein [Caldilineaceae bacterium]
MTTNRTINLVRRTIDHWQKDQASRMAAALAYFTAISIAPMSLLVIVIAGFVYGGERAARMQLMQYVYSLLGPEASQFVDMVVRNADRPSFGSIAGVLGVITLIWGATNVFTQLQGTLNTIWNVSPDEDAMWTNVRHRLFSFAMVLVIAFLLLVSLALSTGLQTALNTIQTNLPGGIWIWQIANFVGAWIVSTLLFAAIFKILPDAEIAWHEVWLGAALTALFFGIGRFVLSFYLGHIGSAYGVAGSTIAFLIWVYFSAQILFLGAEFTQVWRREESVPAEASGD